jgi:hypothetical protein
MILPVAPGRRTAIAAAKSVLWRFYACEAETEVLIIIIESQLLE